MFPLLSITIIGLSLPSSSDTVRTRWTLAEYVALVESANPELTAARERVAAAEARIGPVRRPPDPMVELELMNRSLPRFGRSSPVAMDQIRIRQSIPIGLGTRADGARARVAVEAGQVDEVRRQLVWRATVDLIEVDRIDRTTAILGSLGPGIASLRNVANARYAVGQAEQSDVIRAQLETTRFGEELIMLRSEREAIVARLNAMALRTPEARIDSIVMPGFPDSIAPLTELVERALRNRPLLAVRRAGRQVAGVERRRAELEKWPELEVGLAYGQQPMPDRTGTDRMVSLMVGATVPIWAGSRQRQMRREAEAMERMADADVIAAEAETQSRVGELVADAGRAAALLALYRGTLLPEARAAAASALASYRSGGVDFETVISGQLAVSRAEIDLIRFGAERARAVAELEYLIGGPVTAGSEGGAR